MTRMDCMTSCHEQPQVLIGGWTNQIILSEYFCLVGIGRAVKNLAPMSSLLFFVSYRRKNNP